MGYTRKTAAGNTITVSLDRLAVKLADLVEAQGITSQAGLNAAIDGATQAQLNAFVRVLIKSIVSINGAGPTDP